MQSSTELRFLLCAFVVLVAIVVPASAAEFSSAPAAVELAPVTSTASAVFLLKDAPPPLIVMALGVLLVAVTVTRRVRRGAN
ncbi:MAG: hypothetical protein ACT4PU_09445 [Planctomycetota bacterium]